MVDLIKAFGRGILYVICFPFFVLALAIFAVIGLLAFIFQIIKSIIYFFTGQKFFPELPEDRELRLMREAEEAKNNPAPIEEAVSPTPTVNPTINPAPHPLMFEEVFGEDEFEEEPEPATVLPTPTPTPVPTPMEAPKEEESIEEETEENKEDDGDEGHEGSVLLKGEEEMPESEPVEEDEADILDDILNPAVEEEEEILETYHPQGTNDDAFEDDDSDEDDTDGGVKIHFDD